MAKCMNQLLLDFGKNKNETSMQMPTVFWHQFPKFGVLLRNCN